MKKLFFSLCVVATTFIASAADHGAASFLNVMSLQVSNVAAISNRVIYPLMTNIIGTTWTNLQGTRISVTNVAGVPGSSTNFGILTTLIKDVSLWPGPNGLPPVALVGATSGSTTNNPISAGTVAVKLLGGAGANSAVTFTFTPIWKEPSDQVGLPYTATAHDWGFAVTGASGTVTYATNAPLHLWPGAWGLRLRSIVNADTDYTGNVWVQECELVGFRP